MTYYDISNSAGPSWPNPPFDATKIAGDITTAGTNLTTARSEYTTALEAYNIAKTAALNSATGLIPYTEALQQAEENLALAQADLDAKTAALQIAQDAWDIANAAYQEDYSISGAQLQIVNSNWNQIAVTDLNSNSPSTMFQTNLTNTTNALNNVASSLTTAVNHVNGLSIDTIWGLVYTLNNDVQAWPGGWTGWAAWRARIATLTSNLGANINFYITARTAFTNAVSNPATTTASLKTLANNLQAAADAVYNDLFGEGQETFIDDVGVSHQVEHGIHYFGTLFHQMLGNPTWDYQTTLSNDLSAISNTNSGYANDFRPLMSTLSSFSSSITPLTNNSLKNSLQTGIQTLLTKIATSEGLAGTDLMGLYASIVDNWNADIPLPPSAITAFQTAFQTFQTRLGTLNTDKNTLASSDFSQMSKASIDTLNSTIITDTQNLDAAYAALSASLGPIRAALEAYYGDTYAQLQSATTALTSAGNNKDLSQEDYDTALQVRDTKQADYDAHLPTYEASKPLYDAARTLLEAATTTLENSSTASATASARAELFTTNSKQSITQTTIQGLETKEAFELLPGLSGGLTATNFTELLGGYQALSVEGTNLQNAYNAYRYLEWQVADAVKRREYAEYAKDEAEILFTAGLGTQEAVDAANAAISVIESEITGYKGQRTSTLAALDTALADYKTAYGDLPPKIIDAVNATKTFYTTWNTHIATSIAAATEVSQHYITDQTALDAANKAAYLAAHPVTGAGAGSGSIEAYYAALAKSQASRLSALSVNFDDIQLPAPGTRLSLGSLMTLIAQIQLAMGQLAAAMADSDTNMRAFNRSVAAAQSSLTGSATSSINDWAASIYNADLQYNNDVLSYNITQISKIKDLYLAYKTNLSAINAVINQINADIDTQNANAAALAAAANSVGENYADAVNAARADRNVARNTMDFLVEEPSSHLDDLSPISTPSPVTKADSIAHRELVTSYLPDPPSMDLVTQPVTFPPQAEINAWNASINTFLLQIAPYSDRIKQAIVDATGDESFLTYNLTPFVAETPLAEVRNPTVSETQTISIYNLIGLSLVLGILNIKDVAASNELSSFFQNSVAALLNLSKSSPSSTFGISLMTLDLSKNPAAFNALLTYIMTSEVFQTAIKRMLEQASIIAGLQAVGTPPKDLLKFLFENISQGSLSPKEKEELKLFIEKNYSDTFINSLINQLLTTSSDTNQLHAIALDILLASKEGNLSEEDIKQMIAFLIKLQQLLFLLIAAFLGTSLGNITPEELFSPEATASLIATLKNMGVSQNDAESIARQISSQFATLFPSLLSVGLTPKQAMAALIALSLQALNTPPSKAGSLGSFFTESLLAILKNAGIIPFDTETFDITEIMKGLRSLINQSSLDESTKQKIILSLEQIITPVITPSPKMPSDLAAFFRDFVKKYGSLKGLLSEKSLTALAAELQKLGISPEISKIMARQLAAQFSSAYPALIAAGLSPEQAMAALVALSLEGLNIPPEQRGAIDTALLDLLKQAGIIPQSATSFDITQILPALKILINASNLDETTKKTLFRTLEQIAKPQNALILILQNLALYGKPLTEKDIAAIAEALQTLGMSVEISKIMAHQLAAQFSVTYAALITAGLSPEQAMAALIALSLDSLNIPPEQKGAINTALLDLLKQAGIIPQSATSFTVAQIMQALKILFTALNLDSTTKIDLLRALEQIATPQDALILILKNLALYGKPLTEKDIAAIAEALQQLGMSTEISKIMAHQLAAQFSGAYPSLIAAGLSPEQAIAALVALSFEGLNIPPAQRGAINTALLDLLKQAGIIPQTAKTFAIAQIIPALKIILNKSSLDETQKVNLLRTLEQIATPQAILTFVLKNLDLTGKPITHTNIAAIAEGLQQLGIGTEASKIIARQIAFQFSFAYPALIAAGLSPEQAMASLVALSLEGLNVPPAQRGAINIALLGLLKQTGRILQTAKTFAIAQIIPALKITLNKSSLDETQKVNLLRTLEQIATPQAILTFVLKNLDLTGKPITHTNIASIAEGLQQLGISTEASKIMAHQIAVQFSSAYPALIAAGLSPEQAMASLVALSFEGLNVPPAQRGAINTALLDLLKQAGIIPQSATTFAIAQIIPALKIILNKSNLDETQKVNLLRTLEQIATPRSVLTFILKNLDLFNKPITENTIAAIAEGLQQLGIGTETSKIISRQVAVQFSSAYPALIAAGLSPEQAMASLVALSLEGLNLSSSVQRGPINTALLDLLKQTGVIPPTATTFAIAQIIPALKIILNKSNLDATTKTNAIATLEQIATPQSILTFLLNNLALTGKPATEQEIAVIAEALQQIGIGPKIAKIMARQLAAPFPQAYPTLTAVGFSPEQAMAFLSALSLKGIIISEEQRAITNQVLLDLLKRAQIIAETATTFDINKIRAEFEARINQSNLEEIRKSDLLRAMRQTETPRPVSTDTPVDRSEPFKPPIPVSDFEKTVDTLNESPPTITPKERVKPILDSYRRINPEERASIEASLPKNLLRNYPDVSKELLAAIVVQLSLKSFSVTEANLLLSLLQIEATQGVTAALKAENDIIRRLFAPSEEDLLIKEYWKKKASLLTDIHQKLTRPATVPPTTREKIRDLIKIYSRNLSNEVHAEKIILAMFQYLKTMTSFSEVAIKRILDPGNSLIRDFSILTRSGKDTGPIIFGN